MLNKVLVLQIRHTPANSLGNIVAVKALENYKK